jgi:hypothetical protein
LGGTRLGSPSRRIPEPEPGDVSAGDGAELGERTVGAVLGRLEHRLSFGKLDKLLGLSTATVLDRFERGDSRH